jgi:hypothetical protein
VRRFASIFAAVAALAALAGCSHSCVPPGWYRAQLAGPIKQPPGAPPLAHDSSFDIPGGDPSGKPTREQACVVQPPNALVPKAAASAPSAATATGGGSGSP